MTLNIIKKYKLRKAAVCNRPYSQYTATYQYYYEKIIPTKDDHN